MYNCISYCIALRKFILLFSYAIFHFTGGFHSYRSYMMTKKKRVHLNPVGPYCVTSAIRSFPLRTEAQVVYISHSIHFTFGFLSSLNTNISQFLLFYSTSWWPQPMILNTSLSLVAQATLVKIKSRPTFWNLKVDLLAMVHFRVSHSCRIAGAWPKCCCSRQSI